MDWAFIYLMFVLKIPIIALLAIVWWAVRSQPETAPDSDSGDGGQKVRVRHPRQTPPRRPRRGPHGDPPAPSPPRTRTVMARAKRPDHA